MPFDIDTVRGQFPALALRDEGKPRVYLDGPGGTQVVQPAIDRMTHYLVAHNANHGGAFRTSRQSDAVLDEAHAAMADLLNATSPDEVIFGQNMTSLTYQMSRAIGKTLQPGDELLLTRMDHDANVAPWLQLAADHDLTVRWLDFDTETYRYRMDMLDSVLTPRTKLAAINYASNALGTINDVAAIARAAKAVGALVYVDAVQYVPHGPTDVQALGCDFLACSVYKFFGPHQGVLWGRRDLLAGLPAYRVRPAGDELPGRWQTGTQSHEGMAGTLGALDYLASLGDDPAADRRARLHSGMHNIRQYEQGLSRHLVDGLQAIPGVRVHGVTDAMHDRVPTVAFTHASHSPAHIASVLGDHNIYVWNGHYYAVETVNRLGLMDSGGMVRVGMVHYNTVAELDALLNVVAGL